MSVLKPGFDERLSKAYPCRKDMGGCGANVGQRCRTRTGRISSRSHEARYTLWYTRERSRPRIRWTNPEKLPREPGNYYVRVVDYDLLTNTTTLEFLEWAP